MVDCPGQIDPGLLTPTEGHSPLSHKGQVSTWELLNVLRKMVDMSYHRWESGCGVKQPMGVP